MKKWLKSIALLLVISFSFVLQAQAATIFFPYPTDNTKIEGFQSIGTTYAADTVNVKMGWKSYGKVSAESYTTTTDFAGIVEGNTIDASKAAGDKIFKYSHNANASELFINSSQKLTLNKGDIYAFSFEYSSDSESNGFYLTLGAKAGDLTSSKVYYKPQNSTTSYVSSVNRPLTYNANGTSYIFNWQNTVARGTRPLTDFKKLNFIINTCDAEMENKQTLAVYRDDTFLQKGIYYIADSSGNPIEQPFTYIDNVNLCLTMGTDATKRNIYVDNFSYKTYPKSDIYENFSNSPFTTKTNTSLGENKPLGYEVTNTSWTPTVEFAGIVDANAADSTKTAGDKALMVTLPKDGEDLIYVYPNYTLNKGDVFTYSFECLASDVNNRFSIIINSMAENTAYKNYVYKSIGSETWSANSSKILNVQSSIYLISYATGDYLAGNTSTTFTKYTVVVNTSDATVGGEQTIAVYRNNTLLRKALFYPYDTTAGVRVNKPLDKINNITLQLYTTTDQNRNMYVDNIWCSKTSRAITHSGTSYNSANNTYGVGNLSASYTLPPIYEGSENLFFATAQYDSNLSCVGCQIAPITVSAATRIITSTFTIAQAKPTLKSFLWERDSMKPITTPIALPQVVTP